METSENQTVEDQAKFEYWSSFNISSRIDRDRYVVFLMCYFIAIQLLSISPGLYLGAILVSMWSYVCVTTQRINDMGLPRWSGLFLGLPVINFALWFTPGKAGETKFGPPPPALTKREKTVKVWVLLSALLLFAIYYVAVLIPAITEYLAAVGRR